MNDENLVKSWFKLSGGLPLVSPQYIVDAVKRLQEREVNELRKKIYENLW